MATKLIRKQIGTVLHLAPRGHYRTLCQKSVELAKDRVSGWISEECAVCTKAIIATDIVPDDFFGRGAYRS